MFEYSWTVRVITNRELSDDAVAVIDDLKEDFADAIENVLDIEDEFIEQNEAANEASNGQPDVIEAQAVYTVPLHVGNVVRVPRGSQIEFYDF
jgi:cytoplasmic iron level regulating protein YaaA (DUF328/UPF0246 family)